MRDETGTRRLDDEADTHRAEVIAALEANVRVVPVLVGDAGMPKAAELPEPLKALAYRNAAVIEDRRFASDVTELLTSLHQFVASKGGSGQAASIGGGGPSPAAHSMPGGAGAPAARPSSMRLSADVPLNWTVATAVLGASLVLIWGVLLPRDWHNEYWLVRDTAAVLLPVVTGVGLASRQWR